MKIIICDGNYHFDGYSFHHEPVFNKDHRVGKPVRSFKEFVTVFKAAHHPRIKVMSNKRYHHECTRIY